MKHVIRAGMIGLISLTALCGAAFADASYSMVENNDTVGYTKVKENGRNIAITYYVNDNGRGPKHQEKITLNAGDIPQSWTIDGTTLMGGTVHEQMQWKDGQQSWTSQSDKGDVKAVAPKLYVTNDGSPYSFAIYAAALLKSPEHARATLPYGHLSITKINDLRVGEGKTRIAVSAWMLSGIDLQPDIILLDKNQKLFAVLGSEAMIRKGYEKLYPQLAMLNDKLAYTRLHQLEQSAAHSYTKPVRIKNVRIFDPHTLALTDLKDVVTFRGHVTVVEDAATAPTPKDEVIVDGAGGTLIAGLHDFHAHAAIWDEALDIAGGVTTIRDMGNKNAVLPVLMANIHDGKLIGPHIIPSGFIEGRSPYSARDGFVVSSLKEGLAAVRWYADRGYIQIKIYNSMKPEWAAPLAKEAHRLGMRVVGHVPAFTDANHMILAGYNEITHVNQLMLGWLLKPGEDTRTPLRLTAMERAADLDLESDAVRHTLHLMQTHHVGWDTTISIVEQLMMSRAGATPANSAAYLDHLPVAAQRHHRRSYVHFKSEKQKARYAAAFQKSLDTMKLFYKNGIRLWPGTDESNGFTLHRELELYTEAGMSPAEALRVATYDGDVYLKRDQEYGSIARDKAADFFLVPGDPTKSLAPLHKIRMVMKGGVVYFPSEIYKAYGITPFAAPPKVTLPQIKTEK